MRLLPAVAFQLWIVLLIVFFGAEVVHQEPMLRIAAQLLFGIPLAAWAVFRLRGRESALDVAIAVALAIYLLVALLGRDVVGSLQTAALVLAYAVLWRLARWVAVRPRWRQAAALGVATGMTISLALNAWLLLAEKVAAYQAFDRVPPLEGLTVFPWETVNAMPILVLVAIPFLAWSPPGWVRRVLAVIVALSAIVVVPISVGRAGWLALGITAVLYFVLRPDVRWPLAGRPSARRAVVVVAGLAAVVLVAVAAAAVLRGLSESGRTELWQQSWNMVTDRPLAGHGPGAYSWARLLYGPEEARLLAVRLTHDVPLQTLIDGGMLLAAALLGVIGTWGWLVVRDWAALGRAQRLGVASLAGFAAACLLDDFSFLPTVIGLVVTIAAFSLRDTPRPPAADRRAGIWLAPVAIAVVVAAVSVPAAWSGDASRTAALAGRGAALAGDWGVAAGHYGNAVSARGGLALYWIELGQAWASNGDVGPAKAAYRRAGELNPGDPRPPAALAQLSSDPAERVRLLGQAADLAIGDPQYAYRLGLALAEAGAPEEAAAAWGRAVALEPGLVGVLPYEATGIPAVKVTAAALAWVEQHPDPAPIVDARARWDIGLYLGQLPSDAPAGWQSALAARRGSAQAALELARRAIEEQPFDVRSYQALAVAAAFGCDDALAQEAADLLDRTGLTPGPRLEPIATRREFVYRETTLGAMQPPDAPVTPDPGLWPWSLVGPPPECAAPAP